MKKLYSFRKFFALLVCMNALTHQNVNAQCNVASGGTITPTCNNQTISGGAGEYWSISVGAGVYCTFSYNGNACADVTGYCVSGTAYTTAQNVVPGSSGYLGIVRSGTSGTALDWCAGTSTVLNYKITTPTASGSGSATVCASNNSYTISGFSSSSPVGTISWASTGDGSFTNGTTANPTYVFGPNDKAVGGTKTLTMTINNGGCTATASFTLTINVTATATGSGSATVCASPSSYNISSGYSATNGTISWTSTGDGTFTNANSTTPTYNFGPNDIASGGTKILTMHVTPVGVCPAATATFSLTIIPAPTAGAGSTSSASVCATNSAYTIPGGYTAANGTISWSSTGDGTFTSGSNTVAPTYTFGPNDISSGGIKTLTMTVTGTSPCPAVTAQFFLTINLLPTASSGTITTSTVCGSTNSFNIPGGYTATNGTISWTSSGDGTFTNGNSTTPTYTFGTNDKANGGIMTLTMTVDDGGACPAAATSFTLTIIPAPVAAADTTTRTVCTIDGSYTIPPGYITGANGTISWTTSGDGAFTSGGNSTTPTYTFGPNDGTNGGIKILTMTVTGTSPCSPATAQFFLIIKKPPVATPGGTTAASVCANPNHYTIPAGYTSANGTKLWTSSGDGTFINPTTATPTYTFGPNDVTTGGIVTLTMTVSNGGSCPNAITTFTLTIAPVPVATAGTTDTGTVCANSGSYTVPTGYSGTHGVISWASSGDGTFTAGSNTTTPTYTLGTNDTATGGLVTLTMSVSDTSNVCLAGPATATFALTIDLLPSASPGTKTRDTACASALYYAIPAGYSSANGNISWTSSGDGTFTSGGTTTTPIYTFGSNDQATGGLITLTMTVDDGGICPPASSTFGLVVSPLPIATAGSKTTDTVCTSALAYTIPAGYSSAYGTISWATSGDGTFTTGSTTLTPTYTFGPNDRATGGVITLTMTVADSGICAPATATFALTIAPLPAATAGAKSTDTICTTALLYTIPTGYSSANGTISWSTSGDGTFSAGTTTTPTYTFGTNDKTTGGLITLTMSVANGGICAPATATFALTIDLLPSATAGTKNRDTICSSALSYTIPTGYSSANGSISWTTSGDGSFTGGGTTTAPTYTFGTNDQAGGVITLTMTVADNGICPSSSTTFVLDILPAPVATPGTVTLDSICATATSFTVPAGYSSANGTISWSSSGDGAFVTGLTTPTPTYLLGPNDQLNGGLTTLTMTVTGSSLCPTASATFGLMIDLLPDAGAGPKTADTACASALTYTIPAGYLSTNGSISWATSGDGTFTTGGNTTTPIYTFGTNDKTTGGVITLTMTVADNGICPSATSTFTLTIFPQPIATAGPKTTDTICASLLHYAIPGYSAANGNIAWTTSGDGTFTAGNTAAPTYIFGSNDKTIGGLIILTMTVTNHGICSPASATFGLVVSPQPTATAGTINHDTLCASVLTYTIPAGYTSANGTIVWSTSGDGTFINDSTYTPTYTFGTNDRLVGGLITLTMTIADSGICAPATATFVLTIFPQPIATAGPKTMDTICSSALSYTIPGYTAANGNIAWTTTGDGTFTAGNTAAPTYIFGSNDKTIGGLITLTMTVSDGGICVPAIVSFGLVVSPQPTAIAGTINHDTLCASLLTYTIPAGYTSANGTIVWSTSGDGTFINDSSYTPTYTFGTNDRLVGGLITLTMTIADSGICVPATATFALTIYPLPIATAGPKTTDTICSSVLSYTIPGYTAANGDINWTTTGDGTFTAGSTTAAPTYTFGPNDKAIGGLITLTMTVTDSGICVPAIVSFGLVVSPQPTAIAGTINHDTLCASVLTYTIPAGYTSANGTIVWSTSGDGTFINDSSYTPTYTFGTNDRLVGGLITLTMTIADSGICVPATATFALTIYPLPIATAGPKTTDTICSSVLSYTIPGYTAANGDINWTTTGDGTFTAGSTTAAPTYTFGPNDKAIGGLITLTMTVTDSGICVPAIVSFGLVVSPQPTATAGAINHDTLCASVLTYTIPAGYTSANGTIVWSTSGDGTFINDSTYTPTYTFGTNDKLTGGLITLTMTIADSGICVPATATFALTIYPLPIATAGPKTTDSICASALSYTIPGYTAANGDINWTTTGDGTFTAGSTTAAPTYTFGPNDNAIGGIITLTMTVTDSGICVPAIAAFTLTIYPIPSTATVGPRQNICASLTSATLGGNTPTVGTGMWTQTSGTGTTIFSSIDSGSSTATVTDTGNYVYTWTISSGACTPSSASETVHYYASPTPATVGGTQYICGSLISASLEGNTPSAGSGLWTKTSGPGTVIFSNVGSGSATATVSAYGTYIFTWTISNGNCPASTANDTVNYYATPTTASVGPTQNFCASLTSAPLGGNTPAVGSGLWTQTSGPGTTTFSNASSGSSTATASVYGTYVYTWTIFNGSCPPSSANVTVNYYAPPIATTIPSLQTACSTLTSPALGGNTPAAGSGLWTQTSGPGTSTFSNATQGSSTATSTGLGTYIYTWTVSNGICPSSSANDTVTYYLNPAPVTLYDTLPNGATLQIGTQTYSQTGVYTASTTSFTGCDSVVYLHLFVDGPTTHTDLFDTICVGSYVVVDNINYNQTGVYIDTLIGLLNSDSIVTLNLEVLLYTTPTINITVSHGPVVSGMQIDTFRATYTNCTDPYLSWYQDILPLGIHSPEAIVVYPVGSTDSFLCRIDCKGCAAPDHVYSGSIFIVSGISELVPYIQGMNLYPNPTQGTFNMDITTLDISDKEALITITDLIGQPVLSKPIMIHSGSNKETLSLSGNAAGVYIVQLTVEGQSVFSRIVLDK